MIAVGMALCGYTFLLTFAWYFCKAVRADFVARKLTAEDVMSALAGLLATIGVGVTYGGLVVLAWEYLP